MACYTSELRAYPIRAHSTALRNRALAWGNQQCLEAAEVFMTIRRTLCIMAKRLFVVVCGHRARASPRRCSVSPPSASS